MGDVAVPVAKRLAAQERRNVGCMSSRAGAGSSRTGAGGPCAGGPCAAMRQRSQRSCQRRFRSDCGQSLHCAGPVVELPFWAGGLVLALLPLPCLYWLRCALFCALASFFSKCRLSLCL